MRWSWAALVAAALVSNPGVAQPKQAPRPKGPAKAAAAPDAGAAAASPSDAGYPFGVKPFTWDVPKVLSAVQVPQTFETNGIPNRFQFVLSGMPMEELYEHFYRSFSRAHLYIAPPEQQMKLGDGQVMLTAFDTLKEVSYSVILQPYPDGNTGVILGEAHWAGRTFQAQPSFVPVIAGAAGRVTTVQEGTQILSYVAPVAPEAALQFYRDELGKQGYVEEPKGSGTFQRGEALVLVAAQKLPGEPGKSAVMVSRRVGTKAP